MSLIYCIQEVEVVTSIRVTNFHSPLSVCRVYKLYGNNPKWQSSKPASMLRSIWRSKDGKERAPVSQTYVRQTLCTNQYEALKNGHATRPLAVVQKKTLSGIGKDRDEAVPFWDQYVCYLMDVNLVLTKSQHIRSYSSKSPYPFRPQFSCLGINI